MLRTAQSKNLLTDADKLYSFAREALGTLTVSKGIADLTTLAGLAQSIASIGMDHINFVTMAERSEERRVGKECRSRWSPYH